MGTKPVEKRSSRQLCDNAPFFLTSSLDSTHSDLTLPVYWIAGTPTSKGKRPLQLPQLRYYVGIKGIVAGLPPRSLAVFRIH